MAAHFSQVVNQAIIWIQIIRDQCNDQFTNIETFQNKITYISDAIMMFAIKISHYSVDANNTDIRYLYVHLDTQKKVFDCHQ